jgi:hypothetical protein
MSNSSPTSTENAQHGTISEWDELEARSLLSAVTHGAQDTLEPSSFSTRRSTTPRFLSSRTSSSTSTFSTRAQIIVLLALCALVSIFKEEIMGLMVLDKEVKLTLDKEVKLGTDKQGNDVRRVPVDVLKQMALKGKKQFDDMVLAEYGKYAEQLFNSPEAALNYFKSPSDVAASKNTNNTTIDKSRDRLKRRIKIKVIESQLNNGNDITNFTWVIGGHSAAAGHGNLLRQAYANIIEQ